MFKRILCALSAVMLLASASVLGDEAQVTTVNSNVTIINISEESKAYRDNLYANLGVLGVSDEEALWPILTETLPKLYSRTEQAFPEVTTGNKLEKTATELGDVYTLTGEKEDCIIYYIHGGAWVAEIDALHVEFCDKLVNTLGAKVYMPIYPLAPQADWQDGYRMLEAVYDELAKQDKPIIVMGDSAGGNLAIGLVLSLKEQGKRLPDKVVAMAPCVDISFTNPDIDEYAKVDGMLRPTECMMYGALWANGGDMTDYRLSPLYGDFAGFPETMLVLDSDILYPDDMLMYNKMLTSGVKTDLVVGEGFWHVFGVSHISERQIVIDLVTDFCK